MNAKSLPAEGAAMCEDARLSSQGGKIPQVTDRASVSEGRPACWRDRWMVPGICILLAVLIWSVFGQTRKHDFINFDDDEYVYENYQIAQGLTLRGIEWAFTHNVSEQRLPLTVLSNMLDCQFYGLNAGGHHVTNVLLHMAAAMLLFLVLRKMTGALWRSAMVAALFAVHPLRVESVAWVTERKDVLSGVFFMLTLWAYARHVRESSRIDLGAGTESVFNHGPRLWTFYYWLALAFFALGLMSKATLVTLPFVLLLLDYWPLQRVALPVGGLRSLITLRKLVLEKVPLFGLSVASCVMTLVTQGPILKSVGKFPLPARLENAAISYVSYIWKMICPINLAIFYPHPLDGAPILKTIGAVLALAVLSAGLWIFFGRGRRPYCLIGWLWYLGMLVPMIGVVQVGGQALADRYTYLPQIGLYVVLIWGAGEWILGRNHHRWIAGGMALAAIAGLSWCAFHQTSYWRNSESLWTHTLAVTENNAVAYCNLGSVFLKEGKFEEAAAYFRRSLKIDPDERAARCNLGLIHMQKGELDAAIACFKEALEGSPNFAQAHNILGVALFQKGRVDDAIRHYEKVLEADSDNAYAHNNVGLALVRKGRIDEAITHYKESLAIYPDNARAHNNLGGALFQKGRLDEAIAEYKKSLEIEPVDADVHYQLGLAFFLNGRENEAILHYERALEIRPDYVEAQNSLAWVQATSRSAALRNGAKAVELAERVNQLTGGEDPVILQTLAAAYAEAGRFSDAQLNARKALRLAQAEKQQNPVLVEQINGELKFYEAGLPFHEDGG